MEKIKTILDRKPLSSDYIKSKQDFGKVMKGVKSINAPVWKSSWFYGAIGVTAIAIAVTALTLMDDSEMPESPTTLNQVASAKEKQVRISEVPTLSNHEVAYVSEKSEPVKTPKSEAEKRTEGPVSIAGVDKTIPPEETVKKVLVKPEAAKEPEVVLTMPHIAGVSEGPIAFQDFCNSLGLQVGEGVSILGYTIQYSSCTREVVARCSGNRIPPSVCEEIRACGENIEITFSNIKGQNTRNGNFVSLDSFSVVTTL